VSYAKVKEKREEEEWKMRNVRKEKLQMRMDYKKAKTVTKV
jgi:hypothetical protein